MSLSAKETRALLLGPTPPRRLPPWVEVQEPTHKVRGKVFRAAGIRPGAPEEMDIEAFAAAAAVRLLAVGGQLVFEATDLDAILELKVGGWLDSAKTQLLSAVNPPPAEVAENFDGTPSAG